MSRKAECGGCGECAKCKRAAYMREWYRRPGNAEAQRQSQKASRKRRLEAVREYDRKRGKRVYNLEAERARNRLRKAVERGKLVPQPCEVGIDCEGRIEAHHDDYSRPLDVRWLCQRHHMQLHRKVA